MWIEAIVTRDDLVHALEELLPVKIHLDGEDEPARWLRLHSFTEVSLVPHVGVRIVCAADLMWSVVGVHPRIKLDQLSVLLKPMISESRGGDALTFRIEIEEADFHAIPSLIDSAIVEAVNAALATKTLTWGFSEWLRREVGLGETFEPLEAVKFRVAWGKTRITEEAFVLVLSLDVRFMRFDDDPTEKVLAIKPARRELPSHPG